LLLGSNSPPDLLAKLATIDPEISRFLAATSVSLSLAFGCNRVLPGGRKKNRFNGFPVGVGKTAEAVAARSVASTRLKPGANEIAASAQARLLFSRRQRSTVPPVQVLPLNFEL
jgi:hypothetical protein